jgi:tetratricopeptide (TPR) repeat protein
MMAERNLPLALTLGALVFVVCVPALGKPPAHLDPFPEDRAENHSAPAKPAKPQPPKSDFQPRFRVPSVKQANRDEPAVEQTSHEEPADAAGPLEPVPADADAKAGPRLLPASKAPEEGNRTEGREALDEAYAKSKAAKSEDDYTEVIRLCRSAKEGGLAPKYEDYAHRLMGWAFNRRGEARSIAGKNAEALDDFEAAVAAGGNWRAIHNRGVGYAGVGRLKEAMADLNRAIELNPRYPNAYFNRAELRCKANDYEGALKDYSLAIKLGARDSAVYTSRGHAYYRMERFGDALRDYGEAIKLDPENAAALINRGDAYSDLGKYGEAAKDYRAAVRMAPKDGRAFQAAAWLMATCPDTHYRDDKLAIDAAGRAIELAGPSFRNLSTLAAAQASSGLFKEAQETQEQAIAAATKEDVVTAEKMMSLYRREIAYRDRPFTAFKTPEQIDDKQVRQATAIEPARPSQGQQPKRAWFQEPTTEPNGPAPRQPPSQNRGVPGRPPKARLFGPRGRI